MSDAENTAIHVRVLSQGDLSTLENVADDVFDLPVRQTLASEFIADDRHHIAVALSGDRVVGFASGVHYLHPDKRPELFINEVGVSPKYQRLGIGRRLLNVLLAHAESLGCQEAWVLTHADNLSARRFYQAAGGIEEQPESILFSFDLGQDETSGR